MSAPEVRSASPLAVLGDGLTVAAGSSKLLRNPSIYIGLLVLALAGPGIVSELWVLSWSESVDVLSFTQVNDADQAVAFAAILVVMALLGLIVVSIEGGAIGAMLIAGRVFDRPITLRAALERSRRVFWRLVRAALAVGLIEVAASAAWRTVTNAPPLAEGVPDLSVDPLAGAIVALPFIYSSVAIVVADDGARASLRRSFRLARQRMRLAFALAAFALLLTGVLEALALGSGIDLIVRLTEALNLDVTTGGLSLVVAATLGLLIATAVGSLLFTVAALVSAPQVVAWERLGLPTDGLPPAALAVEAAPEVADPGAAPSPSADLATAPSPPDPDLPADGPPSAELGPAPPPTLAEALVSTPGPGLVEATASVAAPVSPPPMAAWGAAPPEPAPSAWALAAAAPPRFRWVTIPMRLTIISLWLIAVAMLIGGPPS